MTEIEFRSKFPAQVEIPVHWGEQDGFGHVNNAVFIRWLEAARIRFMTLIGVELTRDGTGPILAAVSCNFRQQVKFPDTVVSGARVIKTGRSSLQIEHGIWSLAGGVLVADGESTVVMFDYRNQQSSPIPANLREKIAKIS